MITALSFANFIGTLNPFLYPFANEKIVITVKSKRMEKLWFLEAETICFKVAETCSTKSLIMSLLEDT